MADAEAKWRAYDCATEKKRYFVCQGVAPLASAQLLECTRRPDSFGGALRDPAPVPDIDSSVAGTGIAALRLSDIRRSVDAGVFRNKKERLAFLRGFREVRINIDEKPPSASGKEATSSRYRAAAAARWWPTTECAHSRTTRAPTPKCMPSIGARLGHS